MGRINTVPGVDFLYKYKYMFDLGGVLVKYNYNQLADRLCAITKGDRESINRLFAFESLYPVESGKISSRDFYSRYVKKALPGFSYDDLIDAFAEHFVPNIPVVELVRKLKQRWREVYILSNLAEFQKIAVEKRIPGLFDLFDKRFLSYELGYYKPEPEIYIEAIRQIGAVPDKIVFFDDLDTNVEGARNAGIYAIKFSDEKMEGILETIRQLEEDPDFL